MEDGFGVSGAAGYPQSSCLLRFWRNVLYVLAVIRKGICSLCRFIQGELKLAWGNRESKRLLVFIMALYVFMAVELAYGYFTTSLGEYFCIGNCLKIFTHCILVLVALVFYTNTTAVSLFVNLIAFLCSKHQKTSAYTYG